MILYKSKFLEAHYLELQHVMHLRYTEYASYMDTEGVYHEMLNYFSGRIHKRARAIILDMRTVDNLAGTDFEAWFIRYIFPKMASFNARVLIFVTERAHSQDVPDTLQLFPPREIQIFYTDNPALAMERAVKKAKPEQ